MGLLPAAGVVWIITTRGRQEPLEAASRLVVLGAVIFALEHGIFATTCSADVLCPVRNGLVAGDHVRLHVFMAGIYTFLGAGALIVIARTLLRDGRRAGWFTLLSALTIAGGVELFLANIWFSHGVAEDVTPGAETFEDLSFMFLYTYLVAWSAALVLSYRPVFAKSHST